MGLREITTYKYIIEGKNGEIRKWVTNLVF
jgi:gamma-glutamyl phosphate reductase